MLFIKCCKIIISQSILIRLKILNLCCVKQKHMFKMCRIVYFAASSFHEFVFNKIDWCFFRLETVNAMLFYCFIWIGFAIGFSNETHVSHKQQHINFVEILDIHWIETKNEADAYMDLDNL